MTPSDPHTGTPWDGPWEVYNGTDIGNAAGHIATCESPEIAERLVAFPAMREALKAFIDAEDALIAELRAEGRLPDLTEKPWTLTDAMRAALRLAQGDGGSNE